ncbi:DUF397 domain-containing protein [Streptomyces muensis]|uniref:DUF397 domain-containing protein n=1 Tax=Streptomyces muensis TaxID=1077944 RepID=UPI00355894F1
MRSLFRAANKRSATEVSFEAQLNALRTRFRKVEALSLDPARSSYCVEVANSPTHLSIRDSKAPTRATLTFPHTTFTPFSTTLKTTPQGPHAE